MGPLPSPEQRRAAPRRRRPRPGARSPCGPRRSTAAELGTGVALDHRVARQRLQDLRGEDRRVARVVEAHAGDRHARGHLHDREDRVQAAGGGQAPGQRHADHRQVGVGGDRAGQRRGDAGAGDDHAQAAHARVLGVVGDDVGLAVGGHHPQLVQDAALVRARRAAFSIASMSLLEPITMPTRGASTSSPRAASSSSADGSGTSATPAGRGGIGPPASSLPAPRIGSPARPTAAMSRRICMPGEGIISAAAYAAARAALGVAAERGHVQHAPAGGDELPVVRAAPCRRG